MALDRDPLHRREIHRRPEKIIKERNNSVALKENWCQKLTLLLYIHKEVSLQKFSLDCFLINSPRPIDRVWFFFRFFVSNRRRCRLYYDEIVFFLLDDHFLLLLLMQFVFRFSPFFTSTLRFCLFIHEFF